MTRIGLPLTLPTFFTRPPTGPKISGRSASDGTKATDYVCLMMTLSDQGSCRNVMTCLLQDTAAEMGPFRDAADTFGGLACTNMLLHMLPAAKFASKQKEAADTQLDSWSLYLCHMSLGTTSPWISSPVYHLLAFPAACATTRLRYL